MTGAIADVAWREIGCFSCILAHGYFHIEDDIIGNVVAGDIPTLRSQLHVILASIPEPS